MICPNCGGDLPEGSTFCDLCGTKLESTTGSYSMPQQPYGGEAQQPYGEQQQPYGAQPQYGAGPDNAGQQYGGPQQYSGPQQIPYGMQDPSYGAPEKKVSPIVPIIIAVAAVLILGIGGFALFQSGILSGGGKANEETSQDEAKAEKKKDKDKKKDEEKDKDKDKESEDEEKEDEDSRDEEKEDEDKKDEDKDKDETEEVKEEEEAEPTPEPEEEPADDGASPAGYAISGGSWETDSDGGVMFVPDSGGNMKGQWVEEDGFYYYIDQTGYLMHENWSQDGFYVNGNGAWDKTVPQRKDDPDPLDGTTYVNMDYEDPTLTFDLVKNGTQYCIMTETFNFGYSQQYDLLTLGHGTYLVNGIDDPKRQLILSVSQDQKTVIVTERGWSTFYRAD